MNGRGFITISMHELERVKIIEAVVQHRLTIVLAAERLQLCERQVNRLVRRYEAAGPRPGSCRRGVLPLIQQYVLPESHDACLHAPVLLCSACGRRDLTLSD